MQVKITKTDKHGAAKGWPRPLIEVSRLIQVAKAKFVWGKLRKLAAYTGPLYTDSTVRVNVPGQT